MNVYILFRVNEDVDYQGLSILNIFQHYEDAVKAEIQLHVANEKKGINSYTCEYEIETHQIIMRKK